MAKVSYKLPDDMLEKMSMLGDKYDDITKIALEEGAKPLFDTAKSNLKSAIDKDTKQESRSKGDLVKSIRITRPFLDKNGNWGIKVGCEGIDSKGVSNAMKASVLEYGKSDQVARPWLKPSGSKAKKACIEKMKSTFDLEVDKL
jgi:HK97 gp10 family phage protein